MPREQQKKQEFRTANKPPNQISLPRMTIVGCRCLHRRRQRRNLRVSRLEVISYFNKVKDLSYSCGSSMRKRTDTHSWPQPLAFWQLCQVEQKTEPKSVAWQCDDDDGGGDGDEHRRKTKPPPKIIQRLTPIFGINNDYRSTVRWVRGQFSRVW